MKRILLLFMMLLLCGCALIRGTEIAGIRTFDGLSATYPADARQLAIQAALELSRRYPAGQTGVALVSVPGQFGTSLEEELRVFGFALLPASSASNTLHIGYVIDEIVTERMPRGYLQIRTSDGTLFSIVRQLKGGLLPPALPVAQSPIVSETVLPAAPVPSVAPSQSSIQSASLQPAPAVPAPRATGNQNTLLPKAVLTVLPYDWRYQIPDAPKRALRVSWPKNVPWRDAIRGMASEAGCSVQFDESARRVTLNATVDTPRPASATSTTSATVPVAPVSALHPASLPEPSLPEPAVSTKVTPKSEVKLEEPKIIQDALGTSGAGSPAPVSASSPVLPIKSLPISPTAASSPLPVIPASSLASTPHVSPAKTEESDGSDSLLLLKTPALSEPLKSSEIWELQPGSLYSQMNVWAERADYQLVWKASEDLHMESTALFRGSFQDAIRQLFSGLARTGHNLRVTFFQANSVMEVRGE